MRQMSRFAAGAVSVGVALFIASQAAGQMRANPFFQPFGPVVGDPAKGKDVADSKCAACHGPDGNSADAQYPKLAGQDPTYLYWQLQTYRRGQRKSDVMAQIAGDLTDAEAADTASFYGLQAVKPDQVQEGDLVRAGQRIFYGGKYPMTPPCVACHNSPRIAGMPMAMGRMGPGMIGGGMMRNGMFAYAPYLDGQHGIYLIDQLKKFASGERPNPTMSLVASSLSDTDRQALAAFLSGLP
jgi:cytochrome c553